MTGRRRRELAESFRLFASEEQWLLRDVLVGVVALVVWVAGTGALATQIASAFGVPLGLGSGETPSTIAIAVFGALWVLVPAIAVVVRLRHRMLNLRGNVEQYYRLEHPAALLAPPALFLVAVVGIAASLGTFPWYFPLVMIPVGLTFLVRTLAFSYRVYSFSHPLLVQVLLAVSTVVLLASTFAALGTAMGRPSLVTQVLLAAGLPTWSTGAVSLQGVIVSGLAAAALLPVILATGYVLVQTVVALGVRLLKPDVDRSKIRTGQRYPSFLPKATPVQTTAVSGDTTDKTPRAADGASAENVDDAAGGTGDADETGEADEAEDDLDDVSNTRVFTPPADDSVAGFDAGSVTDTGPETGAGATADAGATSDGSEETRAVPTSDDADGASTSGAREYCDACGESFGVDTTVRFCPNCGTALESE